jgi:signal transduction histidine kinase
VVLFATEEKDVVALHVRDGGPGFPAEFLPAAFERFTRGDPARSRGGAGLGLSIVAAIAAAHGGTAGARNLDAGGADVWIELPSSGR